MNSLAVPRWKHTFPELFPRMAAGLAGEGSECFGFDDAFSRDHDWGPGFCLWLNRPDYLAFGPRVQELYDALSSEWETRYEASRTRFRFSVRKSCIFRT